MVNTADDIGSALDDFMHIHQERWKGVGYLGVFHDQRTAAFHEAVAPLLARRGWVYVAFLNIQGRRLAGDYGFTYGGATCTYLGGSVGDKEFQTLGPGHLLRMHLMIDAIRRGDKTFDFMRGAETYKYGFGAVDFFNWELMVFPRPGRSIQWKRRISILRLSLRRRIMFERGSLLHQIHTHGMISSGLARYIVGRARVIASDALQKFRSPERSLVISREADKKTMPR
jgi:hypothetical protein